jgi:radical SAM protein with 4Fe4S-binding SPASM domain
MRSKVPLRYLLQMVHTPDFLLHSIKFAIRKRLMVNFDYNLDSGYSAPMKQVNIKITNACNLRCKTCAQWGESGYMLSAPSSVVKETVPLDVYKKMVDDISGIRPWIYIWGGEPFLYPDLLPLLTYMKQKRLLISVVTNGTRLARHAEALVDIGMDGLMLSVDGPREAHDVIRGVPGTFDTLMSAIGAIQEEKRKRGRRKPYITLVTTISKDNADKLEEIFDIGEEVGADLMLVYYAWFTTEEIGRRHEAVMQEKLGVIPTAWRGYLWSFDEIDPQAVVDSVKRIRSRKYSFPYLLIPNLKYEDIPRYYQEPANTFGYDRCVYPWIVTDIMPNGDVVPCRDYPDYVVGNIKEDSIADIFNGERYRRFRRALKESGGLFPICARCCGLMGW